MYDTASRAMQRQIRRACARFVNDSSRLSQHCESFRSRDSRARGNARSMQGDGRSLFRAPLSRAGELFASADRAEGTP